MRLDSKADNIRALQEGLFGNAPRQWQTVDAVTRDVGDVPIVIRPRVPGGLCWYEIRILDWLIDYQDCHGFDPTAYYFNEPIDKATVTLNAELCRCPDLYLTYATVQDHMRPALRNHRQEARGLKAELLLRHFCCANGYDTIRGLIEMYPDHVIEFTCMTRSYGTLGWRTVVWEVRGY